MKTLGDLVKKIKSFETELKNISGKTFAIEEDENGMVDKECPSKECRATFKVNESDWRRNKTDEIAFCPRCGKISEKADFLPALLKEKVSQELGKKISANWNNNERIPQNIVSVRASAAFASIEICNNCDTRFATDCHAIFCPCCGRSVKKD